MKTPKLVHISYQQGDLLLRRISKIPDGEQKLISKGKCVLAHGESGNLHIIEDEDAELIQIGEQMVLSLTKQTGVKHGEHDKQGTKVEISPGIWEIGGVQEYDYFQKMKRQVVD